MGSQAPRCPKPALAKRALFKMLYKRISKQKASLEDLARASPQFLGQSGEVATDVPFPASPRYPLHPSAIGPYKTAGPLLLYYSIFHCGRLYCLVS